MRIIDPSGMGAKTFSGLVHVVEKHGFNKLGYQDTVHGRIYYAERRYLVPEPHWKIIWATRDFARTLECFYDSTPANRLAAAEQDALKFLYEVRKPVMGNA